MAARRRLALFAYYYPPLGGAGSLRALSFARHLPAHGWEVVVVTPRTGVYGRDPALAQEDVPHASVVRTGTWEPAVLLRRFRGADDAGDPGGEFVEEARVGTLGSVARSVARRVLYFPDSSRGWIAPAVRAAAAAHRRRPFDAVLSSSPPVSAHVAARRFSARAGVPWVADWRDGWTDRLPGDAPGRRRAERLEAELVSAAQGLAAATDGLRDLLMGKAGGPPPAAATVRNGHEPAPAGTVPPREAAARIVLHAGTVYGPSQDLAPFLDALRAAADGGEAPRVRLVGKVDAYTRDRVARAGVGSLVECPGFLPHDAVAEEVRAAAALLLLGWNGTERAAPTVVPAKTYEYLAAGRPILALTPPGTELGRLLDGIPGVTIAPFEDATTVGRWLRAVARGDALAAPPASAAGPYTRAAQAAALARLLDVVAPAGVPAP